MTQPDEEWTLPTRRLGQRVWVFNTIDSTNRAALELAADPINAGLVLTARQQTAGRGQHGRSWLATPDTSVLMSVLLFPPPEVRRPALLTAWVAVCVCELAEHHTGQPARIKWPNDVFLGGRKVCGILIEQQQGTVVGIGLNVRQTQAELDRTGLPEATALQLFTKNSLEPTALVHELVLRLDAQYDALLTGELEDLERRWKERLGLVGSEVAVECSQGVVRGHLLDVSFSGLHVHDEEGRTLTLVPELVRHLAPG